MNEPFAHLKHCILSTEQIQKLYEHLLEREYIERDITSDEFLFLFSGSGAPTVKRIRWKASITLLSIYMKSGIHYIDPNGQLLSIYLKTLELSR